MLGWNRVRRVGFVSEGSVSSCLDGIEGRDQKFAFSLLAFGLEVRPASRSPSFAGM